MLATCWAAIRGALLGLALVPALVVVPAGIMLWRRGNIPLSALRPRWDNGLAGQLSKFTLMALITSGDPAGSLCDDA